MKPAFYLFAAALFLASCAEPAPKINGKPADKVISSAPIMKEQTANQDGMIGMIPENATPIKVGLLLPLSGDSAAVGNAMLDAAMLALNDIYMSVPSDNIKSQIILMPRDTGNSANSTAAAAEAVIADGATFIVGPLFSQAVTAMKPLVKSKNVPVISFSNNKLVAEPNIFTYGYLPEQQVKHIAEYAYLHNFQRIALLAPNDAYGQKVRDEISSVYSKKGGTVSPAELYAPSQANIEAAVARLMAAYNNTGEDKKFQALFIADGGYNLKNLINALGRNNFDFEKIKIFGCNLWDDPEIGNIAQMQGAWFPGAPQHPYAVFEKRFSAAYGYKPTRLSSLSYDVISLLANISMGSDSGTIDVTKITNQDGHIGPANGLYRLRADGSSERKLAIMEVTPTGFKVVEPSLKSFADPGR